VLTQAGKDAFQRWLNAGGNFVGVHAASDGLRTTPFYAAEVGAQFDYHPELTNAVRVSL
jgi:type 1 glutamine amidotransferase